MSKYWIERGAALPGNAAWEHHEPTSFHAFNKRACLEKEIKLYKHNFIMSHGTIAAGYYLIEEGH